MQAGLDLTPQFWTSLEILSILNFFLVCFKPEASVFSFLTNPIVETFVQAAFFSRCLGVVATHLQRVCFPSGSSPCSDIRSLVRLLVLASHLLVLRRGRF